ncbi:FkbM family methyltransferase [bacterium]|nr:FkbM family methyltransferase [bacterium]
MMEVLKVYTRLPNFRGKNFLGQKWLKFVNPQKKILQTQTMLTGFKLQLDLRDRMQSVMFIKRCHEPETEVVFKEMAQSCKVFFDVGANIGYFSFLTKQMAPRSQIYSFEPLPQNINAYKINRELNQFSLMELNEVCVADQKGETEFLIPPPEESGWGRMAHRDLFSGEKIKRSVITLDDFCRDRSISRVDLIKIDVEGYEFKVLKGATEMIEKYRPKICIELNEPCLLDTGTSGEEIFAYFKQRNYQMYALKNKGLLKVEAPVPYYKYLNYFALP